MEVMSQTALTGTAEYTTYRVPAEGKGYRKEHTASLSIEVRQASSLQAPVAALLPGSDRFRTVFPQRMAELRTVDGLLYRRLLNADRQPVKPGSKDLNTSFGRHSSAVEAREAIRAGLARLILIDGALWEQVEEPVIEVGQIFTEVIPGPSDRGAWQVFALTEYDAAVAAGKAVDASEARFSRKPRLPLPRVEVFIPSVFTMTTSAERVAQARTAAAGRVARARDILRNESPEAMTRASRILMKAANELSRQTGESSFSDED